MQRATTRYGRVAVCRTVVGWLGCWLFALPVCGQQPPAGADASRGIPAAESSPVPARGGGQQADFDSLIELITATIAPDTWQDVGGEGAIQGFPGGVYVDASGLLQRLSPPVQERLTTIWSAARLAVPREERDRDVDRPSALRKVSLRRLQQYLEQLQRERAAPTPAARFLAGLQRVDAVWLDHAAGDCILAGPAGAWTLDREGRCVGVDSGRPVLRLDDWLVLLRQAMEGDGQFLCAITPTQENLSRTQDFLEQSAGRPVPAGQREAWLEELRDALGKQRIEIAGIDPESRVARVIVEADYHMKLVGLGLLPGTDELVDYLDAVERSGHGAAQDLGVLRWWFTLRDHSVERGEAGQLYVLADPDGAAAERKRVAGSSGTARTHGPGGAVEPAIRARLHRAVPAAGAEVSDLRGAGQRVPSGCRGRRAAPITTHTGNRRVISPTAGHAHVRCAAGPGAARGLLGGQLPRDRPAAFCGGGQRRREFSQ